MKFNTSTNTIYEVFDEENKKYVDLAIEALKNEGRTMYILQKRYGTKYDGVGGVKFLNYSESERLNSALRRIDSYIKGIRVLVEVYKESDQQILNRFHKQDDMQILNMLRNLSMDNKAKEVVLFSTKNSILSHFKISESMLSSALDNVKNTDYKRIYLYYYGITRTKMTMDVILKLFPDYNESQIKHILLDIQNELPEYIKIEQENNKNINKELKDGAIKKRNYKKLSISKTTSYGSGFRYTSLFDYFFEKDDTVAQKQEKRQIVLDYLELLDESKLQVIKKIFGDDYNQLVPNVTLSKSEKNAFNDTRVRVRKYIQRILDIRHNNTGRAFEDDRVILAHSNGFKENLNVYFEKKAYPLAMEIFNHYLNEHEEVKKYISIFYDLDSLELNSNVYSSKNDAKKIKKIVKEINDYIKACSFISKSYKERLVNHFKKPYMSDARVELLYEFVLKAIDTISDEEKELLKLLFGEDYNKLNIYANITSEEVDIINSSIEKISKYVSHSLEMTNTYKENIFIYFHKPGMSISYKEKLDAEISRFIDNSKSKGKYVVVMLYGTSYFKFNPSVELSLEQIKLFNSLLDEVREHIKLVESSLKKIRKKSKSKNSTCFLDYFIDQDGNEEDNKKIKEEVMQAIESSNNKDFFFKFYDNNYNLKSNVEMTKEDKVNIRYFRKQIFIKVFGKNLPTSIYEMAINGRTNEERKNRIIIEVDKYLESLDSSIKNILKKVYGEDLHTFNSEAKLTNYELYIINRFNLDLNSYIRQIVSFVKEAKQSPSERVKLPKQLFSFLESIESDMSLEELTIDAKKFVNKSKSKNILSVKKLYGEELGELNESIIPTEEEIKSVRLLIRDIKIRYKRKKDNLTGKRKSNKETSVTLSLPSNILDNFNINYNETNKNMIINRINFNTSKKDSVFSHVLREVYGDNLMEYKCSGLLIETKDIPLFKTSVKVVNNQFTKDMKDCNLKSDFLDYFGKFKENREQLIEEISKKLEQLDSPQANRFKRLISFMYDDNFILVRPMQLKAKELVIIDKMIKSLSRVKEEKKIENKRKYNMIKDQLNFFDYFLFDGENEVPESRKNTIVKIVRGSKSLAAKLVLDLFGPNLDQECNNIELLNKNKAIIGVLIRTINKRLTNTYSRGLFMLADNFIEQFYLETDTNELKEILKNYIVNYLNASHSKCMEFVREAYDSNYNLKKSYKFNGDKKSYNSFLNAIRIAVNKYRSKILGGNIPKTEKPKEEIIKVKKSKPIKIDMMDLGEKGYLALTNDLFDIRIIGNEEIEIIDEESTDDVILKAYNELRDSKTIIDLLMISEDTLVNFYLKYLDDLADPQEAFNYLINLGSKDIIKRLMISPLFLRVINYLSNIEREIIYLKLVQVSNSSLSDEIISKITGLDIDSIREYQIMTKDDKVNSLNEFIIKRK